jgi:hypothetical protein
MVLDVSYVGTRGVALARIRDINQPRASATVAGGQLNVNAARPFPGFAAINTYETTANSIYHSMQVSATRRFTRGFSFQGSYTWAKSLDNNATPLNSYADSRMERARSNFDRTHVLVLSYVYELPFFKSQSGTAGRILGGWQLSGISRFESGTPFTVTVPGDRAGVGGGSQRPELTSPLSVPKEFLRWFTTNSFWVRLLWNDDPVGWV